jgi:hypothetical protein
VNYKKGGGSRPGLDTQSRAWAIWGGVEKRLDASLAPPARYLQACALPFPGAKALIYLFAKHLVHSKGSYTRQLAALKGPFHSLSCSFSPDFATGRFVVLEAAA